MHYGIQYHNEQIGGRPKAPPQCQLVAGTAVVVNFDIMKCPELRGS